MNQIVPIEYLLNISVKVFEDNNLRKYTFTNIYYIFRLIFIVAKSSN